MAIDNEIAARLRRSDGFTVDRSVAGHPLIHPDFNLLLEAAEEIERLQAANTAWCEKWERMACEWCGSTMNPEQIDILDMLLDTPDPLSRSGACIFCGQRVGTSIFSSELRNPDRHHQGCVWVNKQLEDPT